MFAQAAQFLLDILVQPYAGLLLLRFHLQWLRAPLRNPLGAFLMAVSDFVVLPARRVVASMRGLDTATLLLAGLVEMLYLSATLAVQGYPFANFPVPGLFALTAVGLLKLSLHLLIGALLLEAILSWVNPHTPLAPVLATVNRPFLAPLRRRLPTPGNMDFSVLVALIVCNLMLIVPVAWLESLAMSLL